MHPSDRPKLEQQDASYVYADTGRIDPPAGGIQTMLCVRRPLFDSDDPPNVHNTKRFSQADELVRVSGSVLMLGVLAKPTAFK
jgi:hypothetical protein